MALLHEQKLSTSRASLIGIGIGMAVLALYIVGGLVLAQWGIAEFFNRLTIDIVGWLLLAGSLAIAVFAVPVATYLRFQVVSPLIILLLVIVAWLSQGFATGTLTIQTVFGLAFYALGLAPLYLVLYIVFGGVEYYTRD